MENASYTGIRCPAGHQESTNGATMAQKVPLCTERARRPAPEEGLSVVLPAYNEAKNLPGVLAATLRTLRAATLRFEIIVVDDGSKDGTAGVAKELSEVCHEIRFIRHPCNLGYGAAMRTGFSACNLPWVFLTDADGQFDVDELPALFPIAIEADIVAGYRMRRQDPPLRLLNAAVYRLAVHALLGLRVRDVDCAFKLMRREVVQNVQLHCTGAVASAELLVKASRAGFRIVQVGVHHYPRVAGEQSGARMRVVLRAMRELALLTAEARQAGW